MSDLPEFTVDVDQNPYLPAGGREMHAVVTVRSRGAGGAAPGPAAGAVEIVIVDASGSMGYGGRLPAAVRAAEAAVGALRDGVRFAVIAGATRPTMVYPRERTLAEAGPATRRAAAEAVGKLDAYGGTAIGSWLRLAADLAKEHAGAVRHTILLTDGKNQHEDAAALDAALEYCAGAFVCDALGVGTDWEVAELRKISTALLGGFLDVPEPAGLAARFRDLAEDAMGKEVADVRLRVWTPQHAELVFLKQMVPAVDDLTGRRDPSGPRTGDYPLGSWGTEDREYHLCVRVRPGDVGRQMRAAWVKLLAPDGTELAAGDVLAEWTEDEAKSTRISARVAHHTGQSELADAIREGLEARRLGDEDAATARLGRAVVLARRVGNDRIAGLLDRVVDVIDAESGTVRLKKGVSKADEISLDTRSVRTVRTRPGAPGDPAGEPADDRDEEGE
ncbi:VWA domain-containing protein [Actinomadura parmotrematis]|uniref:VWA domain-containing protein n=1 Tax=Actinomadura parmotrematis TaxID=2864039 RepID=A0ABS7FNK8_9ACTN|nr:VWA domain-containing protein [Actinomadura parmotrematis]MBW8481941.1 VWA domain-containing protein [Actinomadura parmotrematis]